MQKLKFHQEAFAEFEHAIRYYESERVGLGLAFLRDFERTRDLILEFPAIGREVHASGASPGFVQETLCAAAARGAATKARMPKRVFARTRMFVRTRRRCVPSQHGVAS